LAGVDAHIELGFHVPKKLKPIARVICWLLHNQKAKVRMAALRWLLLPGKASVFSGLCNSEK
jgi:hypothetical protein